MTSIPSLPSYPMSVKMKTDKKIGGKVKLWLTSANDIKASHSLNLISLSTAEKLVKKGESVQDYPQDTGGIVYFIASSSIAQKIIESKETSGPKLSEAYYLAGLVETHLSQSIWINEVEHYFELAITTDPKSKWAKMALDKLESEYVAGYSGSSGTHIPDDIKQNLSRLKELVR